METHDGNGRHAAHVEPELKKKTLARLKRIEGQVRGLQRMVEEERYCVEAALAKAPGVHRAGVNLATSRATVEYDPARAGVRDFMRVVRDTGYGTAGTARADFVVDDSARPSGSPKPLEDHLLARHGVVS